MEGYTAEKRFENGKPTLYVNGRKTLPVIYALSDIPASDTLTEQAQRQMRHFAEKGIHLIQVHIFLYKGWHKSTPYDYDHIIGELQGVLNADPNAAIMLRLHLGAPYWWLRDHPEEICIYGKGEKYVDNGEYERLVAGDEGNFMRASIASEKWKNDTAAVLSDFCRVISETEQGKHIFAIQIAGGVYAEWHQWGFGEYHPDYSPCMTRYLRVFLKQKYRTDENLRQAWRMPQVTLDTAVPAPPELRHLEEKVPFRVPGEERYVLDSLEALQRSVTDAIMFFSDVVKEKWPRPVLTGSFYGYFDGGWSAAAIGGHLDVNRLAESGKIDFMAAPFPYHPLIRDVKGVSIARSFLESMRLNGVLWLTEMDCAPVGTKDYIGGDPALLDENIAVFRSHAIESLLRGHGMWYFDHRMFPSNIYIKNGWWDTPRWMDEIGQLYSVCKDKLLDRYTPEADVLLVFDTDYYYYAPYQCMFSYGVIYPFLHEIGRSGVCYDSIYMPDLPKAELERYRCIVFVSSLRVTRQQRDFIREKVLKDQRTVLWMHASGYLDDDKADVELIRDITGFETTLHPEESKMLYGNKTIETPIPFYPQFCVIDGEAEIIGCYPDGTVAAATRDFDDYRSYLYMLPPTDRDELRALFKKSGAHIYSDGGEAIQVGNGLIAVTCAEAGEVVLTMKSGKTVTDRFDTTATKIYDFDGNTVLD